MVHAFLAFHSSSEGFGEFHGVLGSGVDVFLGGFIVVPSRYPVIPFSAAMDRILLLQVGQLVPSNLSVSLNMGSMLSPDEVILKLVVWYVSSVLCDG